MEFTSVPQGYTDLVLVMNGNTDAATTTKLNVGNGTIDTGANYSWTVLSGTGGAANSYRESSVNFTQNERYANWDASNNANTIINLQNYSNTTTNKTWLTRGNNAAAGVDAIVGLWRNTSAINIIRVSCTNAGRTFSVGSTFSLYGIAAEGAGYATGGYVTSDETYYYHTFTSSGTFTPQKSLSCDYLVVAGGGGGNSCQAGITDSGGGGAGGLRSTVTATGGGGSLESPLSLTAQAYTVTIGAGGSSNSNGSNSIFATITSTGGGRGGNISNGPGNGGSGGGHGYDGVGGTGTSGQGFNGGQYAGGGAGAAAANGQSPGGIGVATIISGTSTYYAGGGGAASGSQLGGTGGGGNGNNNGVGQTGTANTGGGGGGSRAVSGTFGGSTGGSGIVIVRYAK